jgi:hypothetical protein
MPPAAVGIASLVVAAAGAGMSAYSQYQSANYNAQVARNNQIIQNRNASIALQEGTVAEENERLKTGQAMGAMIAQEGASGVNPNKGSALNARTSLAETGELDALAIRYNASLQNWNEKNKANAYGAQAALDQSQAGMGVASSIIGGASSVSGKWLQFNQSGVFGGGGNVNPYAITGANDAFTF